MTDEPGAASIRRPSVTRRLHTADAMILLTAIAVGTALSFWIGAWSVASDSQTRAASIVDGTREHALNDPGSGRGRAEVVSELALHVINLSVPFLAMLSLGLIPIQLLRPRPRLRRLARRPGTAATYATVVALVHAVLFYLLQRLAIDRMGDMFVFETMFVVRCLPVLVGFAIVSSWTTLLIAGRWRAEPTWIDRLGRIVATAWIASGLFTTCHALVSRFFGISASIISY